MALVILQVIERYDGESVPSFLAMLPASFFPLKCFAL